MTAGTVVSRRRLLFTDDPPQTLLNNFVSSVGRGATVVIPLITIIDKLEAYVSSEKNKYEICRSFLSVSEAKAYWAYAAKAFELPENLAQFWVTDVQGLILHLSSLARSRDSLIKCYGSCIHENKIYDLEILWTNDKNLMV